VFRCFYTRPKWKAHLGRRWRHGFDDDNDDGDGDDRSTTAMMDGNIQIDADSDRGGGIK